MFKDTMLIHLSLLSIGISLSEVQEVQAWPLGIWIIFNTWLCSMLVWDYVIGKGLGIWGIIVTWKGHMELKNFLLYWDCLWSTMLSLHLIVWGMYLLYKLKRKEKTWLFLLSVIMSSFNILGRYWVNMPLVPSMQ